MQPPNGGIMKKRGRPPKPLKDRIMARVKVDKQTGCWNYDGYVDPITGYAMFSLRNPKRNTGAHRASYMAFKGDIGDNHVLHKCDNRICLNPDHLYLGDHMQNMRDRDFRGRNFNKSKTHCSKGHPFSGDNLYEWRGKRRCKKCDRANTRNLWRKKHNLTEKQIRGEYRKKGSGFCRRGHKITPENTLKWKDKVFCRDCQRENAKKTK